jgi:hypothetical protein
MILFVPVIIPRHILSRENIKALNIVDCLRGFSVLFFTDHHMSLILEIHVKVLTLKVISCANLFLQHIVL